MQLINLCVETKHFYFNGKLSAEYIYILEIAF